MFTCVISMLVTLFSVSLLFWLRYLLADRQTERREYRAWLLREIYGGSDGAEQRLLAVDQGGNGWRAVAGTAPVESGQERQK